MLETKDLRNSSDSAFYTFPRPSRGRWHVLQLPEFLSFLDDPFLAPDAVSVERMALAEIVRSYKSLATVDRAFRCIKIVDINIRPIHL